MQVFYFACIETIEPPSKREVARQSRDGRRKKLLFFNFQIVKIKKFAVKKFCH